LVIDVSGQRIGDVSGRRISSISDFSGKHINSIVKDQAVQEEFLVCLILVDGTDTLSRNTGNKLPSNATQHSRRGKTLFFIALIERYLTAQFGVYPLCVVLQLNESTSPVNSYTLCCH
jgi:hypothetical protein